MTVTEEIKIPETSTNHFVLKKGGKHEKGMTEIKLDAKEGKCGVPISVFAKNKTINPDIFEIDEIEKLW